MTPEGDRDTSRASRGGIPSDIIEAAADLFSERGYHGTSVNDILTRTSVSKGGFYHHFGSKQDVLVAIHEAFIDAEIVSVRQVTEQRGDPRARLRVLIRNHMAAIAEQQAYVRVFLQVSQELSDPAFDGVHDKRREYQTLVVSLIQECMDEGILRSDLQDSRLVARLLVGMMNSVSVWFRPNGRSMEEITDYLMKIVFEGLEVAEPQS